MSNPRKPAAIRALEGNRGHRPIQREIKAHGTPKMPERLNELERQVWGELMETIPRVLLKAADVQSLERMCIHWAAFRVVCDQIRKLPPGSFLVAGSTGSPIINPLFTVRIKESAAMDKCGQALGLSPLARTRLIEPDEDEDDPLSQMLRLAANG